MKPPNSNMISILAAFISFLIWFCIPLSASADIYTYDDDDGTPHFTDTMPNSQEVKSFRIYEKSGRAKIVFSLNPELLESIISEKASKHGVSTELVKAVIKAESDFDPHAVSKKGAVGLMQLLPKTAYSMGIDNVYDPAMNVDAGCKLLKQLLEKFNGDIEMSLAAYNAGETAVAKHGGIPPYKETINYVQKVIKYYNYRSKNDNLQAFNSDNYL
jgi:soluble lytic murein transglycosylase-like protein